MKLIAPTLLAALLLGACASVTRQDAPIEEPIAPAQDSHAMVFEPVAGREPEVIAALRAQAAPAQAELSEGKMFSADENQLSAQSYVRIGTSRHAFDDPEASSAASEQAAAIGADKVVVYPHFNVAATRDGERSGEEFVAAYYVRLRLPFGATFRDLNAAETTSLGKGVRIGNVIGGSPASEANLLVGDVISRIDGKEVTGKAGFQVQLKARAGRTVQLTVIRNGEAIKRRVRLGAIAPTQ